MLISKEINIRWNGRNKKSLVDFGYSFTKLGDNILINVEHLQKYSSYRVIVECDMCGERRKITFNEYNRQLIKFKQNLCGNCSSKNRNCEKISNAKLKNGISFSEWCVKNKKEDILNRWDYEKNIKNPEQITYGTAKKMFFKCPRDIHESESKCIHAITGMNAKCSCDKCNSIGQFIVDKYGIENLSKIWSTKNTKDSFSIGRGSGEKVWFVCTECGTEIRKEAVTFFNKGIDCKRCSDGISYPEKFMNELLIKTGIPYEREKTFSWSQKKRYDFYIPSLNCIIETHGLQHYVETTWGSKIKRSPNTLSDTTKNDENKRKIAKDNGILNYIVIDCRYSEADFIKQSIISSDLLYILGKLEKDIDFEEIGRLALKSKIIDVCNMWNEGNRNKKEMAKIKKLSVSTIERYLKIGSRIGICDFYK